MKNIYYLITLLLLFMNLHGQAQNLTQHQKDSIVANLYSDWWVEVNRASIGVVEYNIYEAIPVLQSNIWNQDIESRVSYVEAMFGLEYEDTQYYINALFDSLQITIYSEIDSIKMKLKLVSLLFELNDFSKIDYLIYSTFNPQGELDNFLTIDLWNYLLNVPDYEQEAKENLIILMNESTLGENRVRALSWLGNKYKKDIAPIVINRYQEEDDFTFKLEILREYVPLLEFGIASSFLQENLISETDETLKKQILYYLRDSLRVPANYYFVKNWLDDESSYTYMKKLAKVHERIFPGKPFSPNSTSSREEIIDSTISYLIQSLNYRWIDNNEFVNELQSTLQTAKSKLLTGDSVACAAQVKAFQDSVDFVYKDSLNSDPRFVTLEGWKFLYWNAQYILDRLPEIAEGEEINTYSIFATHGVRLEQNSEVMSGNIGVNEIGEPPFMDSGVELSIGISTETPAGYTIKANRIKVKQGATVNADVFYNELDNNGTITGTLNTPLELPLFTTLPEFHTSTPGTENIVVPQNGEYTLTPGVYGEIQVKKNGKLIFTGGEYHIFNFNGGDNNQLLFQSESEVRIKDKFDSGQGSYIGPEDTTTLSADEIIFYVEGINGNNGNLGATPKAAKIGISNTVKANFYVPNGTLWLRQNSEVEGSFIGKDVDVGIGVKVWLSSAF